MKSRKKRRQEGEGYDPRTDDYEIVAFFALMSLSIFANGFWPARAVNRWHDLKLDVLSLPRTDGQSSLHSLDPKLGRRGHSALSDRPVHYLQSLPGLVKIGMALFIVDFIIYWIHRAQHQFELFMEDHAWHIRSSNVLVRRVPPRVSCTPSSTTFRR